jgi:hypothetical protein
MSAQFVGSISVKAIMRVIRTIAGALVGIWLVGDYTSTPPIFLPVLFLVVALASYQFGQLGARQVPYAYFLLGLTTLTVATDGVTDPAQAWQIGLDRSEEILVGIMSSLLVTSVLWPRYAREEFLEAGRAALKTVSQLVSAHVQASIDPANAPSETEKIRSTFDRQLSVLRNLLQAGARESTFFSARLSNYNAFLVSLTNLFPAGLLRDILFAAQGKGGLDALRYQDRGGNRKRVLRDRIKEIKSPRFARVLSVPRRKQFELNFIGHFPLL